MGETKTRSGCDKGLVVMKKETRETKSVRLGSMRLTKKKKSKSEREEKGTERNTREEIRETRSCLLDLG